MDKISAAMKRKKISELLTTESNSVFDRESSKSYHNKKKFQINKKIRKFIAWAVKYEKDFARVP